MATKPTERILDWASGGSTTDPGAGKEATGWEVDDRPPANWWNWILNSFGKWLSYLEDVTDEQVVALGTGRAFGKITSNGSGGASISYNGGNLASASILGSAMRVDTSITFAGTTAMMAVATCESDASCNVQAEIIDSNTIEINGTLTSTGGVWDFSGTATDISIIILGTV